PPPRVVPASNIAYLVPPPIEVPLASRRMGEEGIVMLRVLVGTDGLPKSVSVQRSSGHARLDEQAVWAMKRARFRPQTDAGVPIEWIVIAPLQYAIE
ncbi:MAG: energy transducer TonB, partial [Rubrivivax sp.]|nr:energy transducer TonB [Rubrivivax sp.]